MQPEGKQLCCEDADTWLLLMARSRKHMRANQLAADGRDPAHSHHLLPGRHTAAAATNCQLCAARAAAAHKRWCSCQQWIANQLAHAPPFAAFAAKKLLETLMLLLCCCRCSCSFAAAADTAPSLLLLLLPHLHLRAACGPQVGLVLCQRLQDSTAQHEAQQ
jgi:hypothetical protein